MLSLEEEVKAFFQWVEQEKIELYNEFSLQHELGIFLRHKWGKKGYKIQFERHISYFGGKKKDFEKKEMDICIFNADKTEKYAIELKFPNNEQRPEQMYAFIKDIVFMEQVKKKLGFNEALCVTLVKDKKFYSGNKIDGIYRYFRKGEPITGEVIKPTGKKDDNLTVVGQYWIEWQDGQLFNPDGDGKYEDAKFYVVTV